MMTPAAWSMSVVQVGVLSLRGSQILNWRLLWRVKPTEQRVPWVPRKVSLLVLVPLWASTSPVMEPERGSTRRMILSLDEVASMEPSQFHTTSWRSSRCSIVTLHSAFMTSQTLTVVSAEPEASTCSAVGWKRMTTILRWCSLRSTRGSETDSVRPPSSMPQILTAESSPPVAMRFSCMGWKSKSRTAPRWPSRTGGCAGRRPLSSSGWTAREPPPVATGTAKYLVLALM
mmetsp:Transcript_2143/g.6598  ORF Transcript_2143/g.6598 Transcript_2143/m.6598 type:complete len:230 (+) Transcript_2143:718-1407(+)